METFGTVTPLKSALKDAKIGNKRTSVSKGKEEENFDCYIQNISLGGARLYFTCDCAVGHEFTLVFTIKDREFKMECTVVSVKPFSQKRRFLLQIGKSLDFTNYLNVRFKTNLKQSEFEYIKLNYI